MSKQHIWQSCIDQLDHKISQSQENLSRLRDSSANETKSSAGDKFETSREMIRQEITKAEIHLANLVKQLGSFNSISPVQNSKEVAFGSYVLTNKGNFYISSSLGKIKSDDGFFYCISTESPMGAALLGLTVGESATVNGNLIKVSEIL